MYKQIAVFAVRLMLVIGWIVLMAPQASPTQAQSISPLPPQEPLVPDAPPQVPEQGSPTQQQFSLDLDLASDEAPLNLQFSKLKAVVFVGPIDSNTGQGTLEQIKYGQQTAALLRSYGLQVTELYPTNPNATWANIKAAAQGAHILIYRGHGVSITGTNPLQVGGLWLMNQEYVSSDQIRAELRPAENFIIMMYGSFTAGSTSAESYPVNLEEAKRRVTMYSDPFFDIGAGAYYADWFGDAFTSYSNSLINGQTHRQAYVNFYDFNKAAVYYGIHPTHPQNVMWMGWDEWYDPKPQWNNVFIGNPDMTLNLMFDDPNRLGRQVFLPFTRR